MSQTREERRSALDDFAQKTVPESTAVTPVTAGPMPQVYGAQQVAVRRDERAVLNKIALLAAAAGPEHWLYRYPVKNRKTGTTEYIEGPTIKLANDIARLYGNCEVDCRVEDMGHAYLFHARFVDLETGYALTRPFQQRKGASRLGGADEGRREEIDLSIGASKATRNVIINALQTFADFAEEEAKNAIVEKIGKDPEKFRRTTVERIGRLVSLDRVEAVIGRAAKDWLVPDIARVIAMGKAIADGMATVDETFPPLGRPEPPRNEALERFAASAPDMVNQVSGSTPEAAGEAAVSPAPPSPPSEPGTAATDEFPKAEVIEGLLKAATDTRINPEKQDRLEALDIAEGILMGQYPDNADFIGKAVRLAGKVVTGDTTADKARQYMGGLSFE